MSHCSGAGAARNAAGSGRSISQNVSSPIAIRRNSWQAPNRSPTAGSAITSSRNGIAAMLTGNRLPCWTRVPAR